jgi:hypothetical protein
MCLRSLRRFVLGFLLLLCGASLARAYFPLATQWPSNVGIVVMELQLGSSSGTLIDGATSWGQSAEGALAEWNQHLPRFEFRIVRNSTVPIRANDGKNSVFFSTTNFGKSFGSRTLAVTTSWTLNGRRTEADVVFNTNKSFNSYRGPVRRASDGGNLNDFHRVALHEFGHALGLDHPDEHGQAVTAQMNSAVGDLDSLAQDDIAGGNALWGGIQKAALQSPAPGATLSGASVTFRWSAGSGVSNYQLYVGRTKGKAEIFNSNPLTTLTQTVDNLPLDGSTIHVRLWSKIGANWQFTDYTFKAALARLPNLTLYKPPGWSGTLVLSNATGTSTDGALRSGLEAYLDFGPWNNGNADVAAQWSAAIYLDDALVQTQQFPSGLGANVYYSDILDRSVGTLSAGPHTVKVILDADRSIPESNEADNVFEKAIFVGGPIVDSDSDRLDDLWEVRYARNLIDLSATGDFDRDGFTDAEEFQRGSDPLIRTAKTNQPDGLIGLSTRAMVGSNRYDRAGSRQTVGARGVRGQRKTAIVYVQNDGPTRNSIRVKGTAGTSAFGVQYIYSSPTGAIDVTGAVIRGTFQLPNLPPSATRVLKAIVVPRATAPAGASFVVNLDLSSTALPSARDRVVFEVAVP